MNYVLKTNALCKTYKNYPALNECSMNIPKGSIYGFIGKKRSRQNHSDST